MASSSNRKVPRESAHPSKKRSSTAASRSVNNTEPDDNAVLLTGTVTLVSGGTNDEPLRFRLSLRQSDGNRESLDCETGRAASIRTLQKLRENDKVEVQGSLRRRFWRGGTGGLTSRTFVLVHSATRIK